MIVVTGATGHVGAELPLVAVLRLSVSDPNRKFTIDHYQKGSNADPHTNP